MKLLHVYYLLKPIIPRPLQLHLRRVVAQRVLLRNKDWWPIDPQTATPPPNWYGWPEGKKFALVITHDVEHAKGQARCQELASLDQELGFVSNFNLVPERYPDNPQLRRWLEQKGFEVGVHDLRHDGKLFRNYKEFKAKSLRVNKYIRSWGARGFRAGAMHHNLEWIHELDIEWDSSTFDTDPFEPMPDGLGTIFPKQIVNPNTGHSYIEIPYTMPQDSTLFIVLREHDFRVWRRKLDWIVQQGGMVLFNTHPDYMNFSNGRGQEEYPITFYRDFLTYVRTTYKGYYWNALPKDIAAWVKFEQV